MGWVSRPPNLCNLNLEQLIQPVIIVQQDRVAQFTTTSVVVPLTTNLRRAIIPGIIVIPSGEGGLTQESVVVSYQILVIP